MQAMWFLMSCMQLGVLIQLTYSTLYILPKHKRYPRPVCVTEGINVHALYFKNKKALF